MEIEIIHGYSPQIASAFYGLRANIYIKHTIYIYIYIYI